MDSVGETLVTSEAEETPDKPKRRRVRCPIGKKPKRIRTSGPMVGVKIDNRTKRRLRRAKAAVEFASGETYMMGDLMMKVVSKGLDVVERELKIVDSAAPTPSFLYKPTDQSPIDVKQIEPIEPMEQMEGLS